MSFLLASQSHSEIIYIFYIIPNEGQNMFSSDKNVKVLKDHESKIMWSFLF